MMHTLAAGAIVGSVKKRISQGDCPTEKAFDVETLEGALMEVHRLFEAEQRQRENLQERLDAMNRSTNMTEGERAELQWNKAQAIRLRAALSSIATHFPGHAAGHMAEDVLGAQANTGAAK